MIRYALALFLLIASQAQADVIRVQTGDHPGFTRLVLALPAGWGGVLGLGLSFWLLTQFILELHGFQSAWKVFLSILGVLFSAAMAASLVLVLVLGAGG